MLTLLRLPSQPVSGWRALGAAKRLKLRAAPGDQA